MSEPKKRLSWAIIISFLIGTLFGSGAIWQWQQLRLASKSYELEKILKTTELRNQISELYSKIIEITDEYIKTQDAYEKRRNSSGYKKILKLASHLGILKDDFKALEDKLAQLENRTPRAIEIGFLSPSPPNSFVLKKVEVRKK